MRLETKPFQCALRFLTLRGAHHGAAGLATFTLDRAFIINRDSFATRSVVERVGNK